MAPILEVVARLGVRWQPVLLDSAKKPMLFGNGTFRDVGGRQVPFPSGKKANNDFFTEGKPKYMDDAQLKVRQSRYAEEASHIALDTRAIYQIDVDCPSAMEDPYIKELMSTAPYYLSTKKKPVQLSRPRRPPPRHPRLGQGTGS